MLYMFCDIAAALPVTAALMLYMLREIASELARRVREVSFWILLAREIASAFPETARETDEISSELSLMLYLVSSRILLLLAIASDIAAAFPETAALMLDILVLMLIMLTEAIMSRTVISSWLSETLMSRTSISSSWSSTSPL